MKNRFTDRIKLKGFAKIFCLVLAFAVLTETASAQPSKGKTAAGGETSAASKKTTDLNLPKVTRIDENALKDLLRREGENAKPLLINFWATWCDPCREEFPDLVKLDADYKGKIDFITISLDELSEIDRDVPKFLAEMKATMPAYLLKAVNEDAAIALIAKDWQGALPFTILLNGKGEIAYRRLGVIKSETVRAELEKVLSAQTASLTTEQQSVEPKIVLNQIEDLPVANHDFTYERGVTDAKRDVADGKLFIKRYGLTPGIAPEALKNLKAKYGVEIVDLGCIAPEGIAEYVRGYNEISRAEIKRKLGEKASEIIGKE